MVQARFPASEITFNEITEVLANNLITGFGSRDAAVFGRFSAGGRIVTGIIPSSIFHFLMGVLNISSVPDSDKIVNINSLTSASDVVKANGTIANGAISGDVTPPSARIVAADKPPGRLKFTFDATPTGGTIAVNGFRKIGRPDIDRFAVSETITPRAGVVYSKNYYKQINSVAYSSIAGATMVQVDWDSNTYKTEGKFSTSPTLFPGWDIQASDGGQPAVLEAVRPVNMNFSVGSGGVSVTMEVVGKQKTELRKLTNWDEPAYAFTDEELAHFPLASARQQPVWGSSFFYGDEIIKATNIEIGINLSLSPDDSFDGSRFITDITQDGNREIDFNPTLRFRSGTQASDVFAKWQEILRNDERSELEFRGYNFFGNGAREIISIKCPSSQLVTNEISTTGAGAIDRRLAFYGLPSAAETSEIIVTTETQEEFSET